MKQKTLLQKLAMVIALVMLFSIAVGPFGSTAVQAEDGLFVDVMQSNVGAKSLRNIPITPLSFGAVEVWMVLSPTQTAGYVALDIFMQTSHTLNDDVGIRDGVLSVIASDTAIHHVQGTPPPAPTDFGLEFWAQPGCGNVVTPDPLQFHESRISITSNGFGPLVPVIIPIAPPLVMFPTDLPPPSTYFEPGIPNNLGTVIFSLPAGFTGPATFTLGILDDFTYMHYQTPEVGNNWEWTVEGVQPSTIRSVNNAVTVAAPTITAPANSFVRNLTVGYTAAQATAAAIPITISALPHPAGVGQVTLTPILTAPFSNPGGLITLSTLTHTPTGTPPTAGTTTGTINIAQGLAIGQYAVDLTVNNGFGVVVTHRVLVNVSDLPVLTAPIINLAGTTISWAAVANAVGYQVYVNRVAVGAVLSAATTSFNLAPLNLAVGNHNVQVMAIGDDTSFVDSSLSNTVVFTVAAPPQVTPTPQPPQPTPTPAPTPEEPTPTPPRSIFSVDITDDQLADWDVEDDTEITLLLEHVGYDDEDFAVNLFGEEAVNSIIALDGVNEMLLGLLHNLTVLLGGEETDAANPVTITVDLTTLGLTPEQLIRLTGFVFDEETEEYVLLPGVFTEDGRTFTFDFDGRGIIGIMVYTMPDIFMRLTIGSLGYTLNGSGRFSDVAPFIAQNRTMVPLRIVTEALDGYPRWDGANRVAYLYFDDITLRLPVGEELPYGLGTPVMQSSRVFVPLRYVSQMIGAEVFWDAANRAVYVWQR